MVYYSEIIRNFAPLHLSLVNGLVVRMIDGGVLCKKYAPTMPQVCPFGKYGFCI